MTTETQRHLNVPKRKSVRFERNFIQTAVCELRFPTLLELEENRPVVLQKRLRGKYPTYSREKGVRVSDAGASNIGTRYLFTSKDEDWVVSLRANALSIETTNYTEYGEFHARLADLIGLCKDQLDTDFFTRVGLRYINHVPIDDGTIDGWLNPILSTMPIAEELGSLEQFGAEARGFTRSGQYTFRHGFTPQTESPPDYYLDFDYYCGAVPFEEALDRVREFNEINFSFFMWSLGEKSIDKLGQEVSE